jgi:DNA-binding transcriptional LysR family regulator
VQRWADRIGRRLKLRDLHILLAVAQSGSMTKAAGQLSVSNPVISKAIADLEHTLGVRLLDRSPQGIEPTVYGHALLARGLVAFDELRQAVKHIEFLADPTAGEVRIGTSVALGSGFVSVVVDRLLRKYPRITMHLLTAESETTYRALEDRKVDLVIARMFKPIAEEHMRTEALYHEPQVVAASATNPWTRRRKVALVDLMNEPWTLPPPDSLSGSVIAEAFRAQGCDLPRTSVVASTVPVRDALIASGRFLTVVPDSVLKFPAKNPAIKRLPIDLPTTRRPIAVVTLKNRSLSPVTQLFIEAAREVAKPLGASEVVAHC